MIKSVYLDTSVFGGYFDEEFSADTIPFFERIAEENIIVIVSELLEDELSNAPDFVKKLFVTILDGRIQYVLALPRKLKDLQRLTYLKR